ncbi:MAG: (Fe-S)-binding protein [Gemmatimonadota bacterium]
MKAGSIPSAARSSGGLDSGRPRTPLDEAAAGLDLCVHCGFCLQACPTYLALEDENDSPRGRLVLMRSLVEGRTEPADPVINRHIDQCLGCRGCESACPSGVPYGKLLEATRETLAAVRPLPLSARLVLAVFRRPGLLGLAMGFVRALRAARVTSLLARLPGNLGFTMAMVESTRPSRRVGFNIPPRGAGPRVAVLQGCVMQGLFGETNVATARVLARNGCNVIPSPATAGCCGALHAHAGLADQARELARRNIAAFEELAPDYIAVNSAGCGASMKEYAHLLAGDPSWHGRAAVFAGKVRDVSELLTGDDGRGPLRSTHGHPVTAAWDAPCHLQHGQRVVMQPLAVLDSIGGVRSMSLPDADLCCGSAGIYNLVQPGVSSDVLAPKVESIRKSGVDLVVTANPGCLMQIGAGLHRARVPARVVHLVDLLDAAYEATPGQ